MVLTACVDNTWQVWRSAADSLHDSKFWNCNLPFLSVMINQHVMINQYCLLSLSTKDFANYCFSSFAYWCDIKGLQLLACVVWRKYTFWMLDTGRHCNCVMCDQFSTVTLWPLTLVLFFSSCNPCKFKPTQFSHFSGWIWMWWGKRNDNNEA